MPTKTAVPTIWHMPEDLWGRLAPLLGPEKAPGTPGRPAVAFRVIFDALLYVLRTGCQWRAIPRHEYAPGSTVHGRFRPWHVEQVRREVPGIKVLVHPECERAVVEKSDLDGSTEFIIKTIEQAPSGSAWAIGTEVNLVNRLVKQHPDKHIRLLAPDLCMCATMYRIAPQNLAWALDSLAEGRVVNQITVPEEIARWARVALDRMLAIK